jgi:aspartate carbamoyltransferase catalytic subunit
LNHRAPTLYRFGWAEKIVGRPNQFLKATSSLTKGETLLDTIWNIEAMKIDMVVIRHSVGGTPYFLSQHCDSKIINAGDGTHEHPTQGLLDMLTMRDKYGKLEGLRVVIVGDIKHSRVARSNIWGLKTLGASVAVCGPTTLLPYEIEKMGVDVYTRIEEALEGADVVNVLRLQQERQSSGLLPSLREYSIRFGITKERLKYLKPNFTIMHPAHEPRRRNIIGGRRWTRFGDSAAGHQRRGRQDGCVVSVKWGGRQN